MRKELEEVQIQSVQQVTPLSNQDSVRRVVVRRMLFQEEKEEPSGLNREETREFPKENMVERQSFERRDPKTANKKLWLIILSKQTLEICQMSIKNQ